MTHFRYLIPVWGTCGVVNLSSMQTLQNKVLKVLFNYDRLTHTVDLYRNLRVWKLIKILRLEQCKFMYKVMNKTQKTNIELTYIRDIHSHNTRSQNYIFNNNIRSNKGLYNPIFQASEAFNALPNNIKIIRRYTRFVKELKLYIDLSWPENVV